MSTAPVFDIDTTNLLNDPKPFWERMRTSRPTACVPALYAVLVTNRDETYFKNPNHSDPWRDISKSIPFSSGPHFGARAWASRSLIVNVALPMILDVLPNMTLNGPVEIRGMAFRGPVELPVTW